MTMKSEMCGHQPVLCWSSSFIGSPCADAVLLHISVFLLFLEMFLFDSSAWLCVTVLEVVIQWLICLLSCVQGWGGLLLHPEGSSGIQKHHQILQTQWLWWSGEAPEGAGAGGPEGFLFFHIASSNVQQCCVATPLVFSPTWMSPASTGSLYRGQVVRLWEGSSTVRLV